MDLIYPPIIKYVQVTNNNLQLFKLIINCNIKDIPNIGGIFITFYCNSGRIVSFNNNKIQQHFNNSEDGSISFYLSDIAWINGVYEIEFMCEEVEHSIFCDAYFISSTNKCLDSQHSIKQISTFDAYAIEVYDSCDNDACAQKCGGCDGRDCMNDCEGGCKNDACGAGSCSATCAKSCFKVCAIGCRGGCSGSCDSSCRDGCKTSCQTGCQLDCNIGCLMTCKDNCSTTCSAFCFNGCKNSCLITCVSMAYGQFINK